MIKKVLWAVGFVLAVVGIGAFIFELWGPELYVPVYLILILTLARVILIPYMRTNSERQDYILNLDELLYISDVLFVVWLIITLIAMAVVYAIPIFSDDSSYWKGFFLTLPVGLTAVTGIVAGLLIKRFGHSVKSKERYATETLRNTVLLAIGCIIFFISLQ